MGSQPLGRRAGTAAAGAGGACFRLARDLSGAWSTWSALVCSVVVLVSHPAARNAWHKRQELHEIEAGEPLQLLHREIPWARLLRLQQLQLLAAAYFCYAWGSWFFLGWFATWMVQGAGFSVRQMGVYASFPFAMAMCGNLAGGALSERLVARKGARAAYRWVTAVCLAAGAALLLAMSAMHSHVAIVVVAAVAFGVMDLMLPSAWAMCMALGGSFGGTATAVMNTAGNLGAWLCALLFGYVVKDAGSYNLPLQGSPSWCWRLQCFSGVWTAQRGCVKKQVNACSVLFRLQGRIGLPCRPGRLSTSAPADAPLHRLHVPGKAARRAGRSCAM